MINVVNAHRMHFTLGVTCILCCGGYPNGRCADGCQMFGFAPTGLQKSSSLPLESENHQFGWCTRTRVAIGGLYDIIIGYSSLPPMISDILKIGFGTCCFVLFLAVKTITVCLVRSEWPKAWWSSDSVLKRGNFPQNSGTSLEIPGAMANDLQFTPRSFPTTSATKLGNKSVLQLPISQHPWQLNAAFPTATRSVCSALQEWIREADRLERRHPPGERESSIGNCYGRLDGWWDDGCLEIKP